MKTSKEIKKWLEEHNWYKAFKNNVCKDTFISGMAEKILNGEFGIDTISGSFTWFKYSYDNINGINFWSNVNKEFKDWYNS